MAEHHGAHEPDVALAREHEHDVDVLDPDEPQTPGWLPLLGAVLFVFAAIAFIGTRPPAKTTEEMRKDAAALAQKLTDEKAAAAAALAPPPQPEQAPAQRPQQPPSKGG